MDIKVTQLGNPDMKEPFPAGAPILTEGHLAAAQVMAAFSSGNAEDIRIAVERFNAITPDKIT